MYKTKRRQTEVEEKRREVERHEKEKRVPHAVHIPKSNNDDSKREAGGGRWEEEGEGKELREESWL